MNALGYFLEQNEEMETEYGQPPAKSAPEPTTEAERVRAWFNGLNFETMPANEAVRAEFFKYEVAVFHAVTETYNRFYMSVMSPQKKSMGRRSFPDTYARGTKEDIAQGIERFLSQMEAKQARHNALKQAKQQARAAFVNPYKAGEFLHSSWGYDQTNVEMYQILEVKPMSLKIRRVAMKSESTFHDGGTCSPIRDRFMEPARWVTIQVYDGNFHRIPSPIYGSLYKYEGQPVTWTTGH